ncbi:methylated-DNA--[protein]-cysteine S-methyltransferase [Caulobacter sp. NIBR1757]|uniref:methylated-DNA--[protein]-cysteine S-methyltransferase n=1 Tax=Caulobacter sp. NIBR1757 TaxID=3016000 RepID=UPI0022F06F19|nr:methylated-DNA--[protein]-cysteine S-methyltransferase [Caulobacter sp. NIBR1757]WGM40887.1 Methylated-DNA--protein-cysteine methyltransferase [Caulobacter sp. NIBR1757]
MPAKPPETLTIERYASPIDGLWLAVDEDGILRLLHFDRPEEDFQRTVRRSYPKAQVVKGRAPPLVRDNLDAYFKGDLPALERIPTQAVGSDFQQSVWNELKQIPVGETRSYGAMARKIGQPSASRAVGLANGSNPIAVVVPCHRVIGADGSLTGFGGGIPRKRWLLEHEGAHYVAPTGKLF